MPSTGRRRRSESRPGPPECDGPSRLPRKAKTTPARPSIRAAWSRPGGDCLVVLRWTSVAAPDAPGSEKSPARSRQFARPRWRVLGGGRRFEPCCAHSVPMRIPCPWRRRWPGRRTAPSRARVAVPVEVGSARSRRDRRPPPVLVQQRIAGDAVPLPQSVQLVMLLRREEQVPLQAFLWLELRRHFGSRARRDSSSAISGNWRCAANHALRAQGMKPDRRSCARVLCAGTLATSRRSGHRPW